jgi:starch synthase
LRILMVTAELAPLAKTGGLADMVAGLSGRLATLGHDVRVLLPAYGIADDLATAPAIGDVQVSPVLAAGTHPPYRLRRESGGCDQPSVYRVCSAPFFAEPRIYMGSDLDAARFALLAHAALRLCAMLQWYPDIIHCHDWHAALLPALLRSRGSPLPASADSATVLTIHNIGYQGIFSAELLPDLGLAAAADVVLPKTGVPESLNFLRSGIRLADALTTVSPSHAAEILTPEFGKGLDSLLRERAHRLVGILNGVDYGAWDPGNDPHLVARYQARDLAGKAACKADLRRRAGLREERDTPLFGMVTRLASQKGVDLVLQVLPDLLDETVMQFVIVGDGDGEYVTALRTLADRYPGTFSFINVQDEAVARSVFAGADAFVVPSIYEPCGLTQMYALRYGAVPVVRATGGLQDTVMHFDTASGRGTGCVFRDADAGGLRWAIDQVLQWYRQPADWAKLIANGMGEDFSWEHQAPAYEALYRRVSGRS